MGVHYFSGPKPYSWRAWPLATGYGGEVSDCFCRGLPEPELYIDCPIHGDPDVVDGPRVPGGVQLAIPIHNYLPTKEDMMDTEFICTPCKGRNHDDCKGITWCDCQHGGS